MSDSKARVLETLFRCGAAQPEPAALDEFAARLQNA